MRLRRIQFERRPVAPGRALVGNRTRDYWRHEVRWRACGADAGLRDERAVEMRAGVAGTRPPTRGRRALA